LEIRDGVTQDAPILFGGRLCGHQPPVPFSQRVHALSRSLHITFVSDDEPTEDMGFVLTPSVEEVACKAIITEESGFIKSTNYPGNYGPNEYCIWKVAPSSGRPISIEFRHFKVNNLFQSILA
jgi:hypothetical protein